MASNGPWALTSVTRLGEKLPFVQFIRIQAISFSKKEPKVWLHFRQFFKWTEIWIFNEVIDIVSQEKLKKKYFLEQI